MKIYKISIKIPIKTSDDSSFWSLSLKVSEQGLNLTVSTFMLCYIVNFQVYRDKYAPIGYVQNTDLNPRIL